jgi:FKBP-type peptidyl-prolyl cis-trans isomerase FkpA
MKNKTITGLILLATIILISLSGCDPTAKWEKQERLQIDQYIASLGDTVYTLTPSGLYYISVMEGVGAMPVDGDTVSIRYYVRLLTGEYFDSNLTLDDPYRYVVGSGTVIDGIEEGVKLMREGGTARLLTPSSLAYGPNGIPGIISGYAPLLWDIQLTDVAPGP